MGSWNYLERWCDRAKISVRQIHQFCFRLQFMRLRGFRSWLVSNRGIFHSHDEKNEPGQTESFEGCLSQIIEHNGSQKSQFVAAPNKISEEVKAYFTKGCND